MTIAASRGAVFFHDHYVGVIEQTEDLYVFCYDSNYLADPNSRAISVTLPLQKEAFTSPVLFPFFDGLIAEGWLLGITITLLKLNQHDRMSLLLSSCEDCIGAVSIKAIPEESDV